MAITTTFSRPGPSTERVAELCHAAAAYVQRVIGVSIDTSEESLAFIDHYLNTVRDEGPIVDEALVLISAALGAHLGQVAIAKFGGHWRAIEPGEPGGPGDIEDPANWRVDLSCAPLSFDPVGMAAEALRQEEVEGYDASFTTRPDLSERLAEVLGRVPTTADYYYSLTGRMETLTYAVDILLELLRLEKEPQDREPEDLTE